MTSRKCVVAMVLSMIAPMVAGAQSVTAVRVVRTAAVLEQPIGDAAIFRQPCRQPPTWCPISPPNCCVRTSWKQGAFPSRPRSATTTTFSIRRCA